VEAHKEVSSLALTYAGGALHIVHDWHHFSATHPEQQIVQPVRLGDILPVLALAWTRRRGSWEELSLETCCMEIVVDAVVIVVNVVLVDAVVVDAVVDAVENIAEEIVAEE
jgi:hypothetical protein